MVRAVPLLGLTACGDSIGAGMVTSPGQVDLGRPAWR
jgi:hypothetical protein